jgi:hypothetical protein
MRRGLPLAKRLSATVVCIRYGDLAQLVEHLLCKQGVTGSNPVVSIRGSGSFGIIGVGVGLRKLPCAGRHGKPSLPVCAWPMGYARMRACCLDR